MSQCFASRMLSKMDERGLDAVDLAALSGVDYQVIQNLKAGRSYKPHKRNQVRIAAALGVSVDWLLYGVHVATRAPKPATVVPADDKVVVMIMKRADAQRLLAAGI